VDRPGRLVLGHSPLGRLLGKTLLIAYVGTLTGTVGTFVAAFGLGAIPGVLAIAIHTISALGKLFAEVVENIDMKPVEGVAASGGTWFAQVRFGALPQVLSNYASYALLRLEINVRGATIIGVVGAGGLGLWLSEAIRVLEW
jgi:phosphonate transport system permease protein